MHFFLCHSNVHLLNQNVIDINENCGHFIRAAAKTLSLSSAEKRKSAAFIGHTQSSSRTHVSTLEHSISEFTRRHFSVCIRDIILCIECRNPLKVESLSHA